MDAATILSPASATFKIEYVTAAEPDATAIPAAPPSSCATRAVSYTHLDVYKRQELGMYTFF